MFGELDDSAIYENAQDYDILGMPGRDDDQNGFANSYDAQGGYSQVDDSDIGMYSNQPQYAEAGVEADIVETADFSEPPEEPNPEVFADSGRIENMKPQSSSGSMVFIALLVVVFLAAAGLFAYKKFFAPEQGSQGQEMGDMFYDQTTAGAQGETPAETQVPAANGETATVDVDLSVNDTTAQAPVAAENPQAAMQKAETPAQKAEAKKKADEAKANKFVNVAVSSGGRPDPFLPYGAGTVAIGSQAQFDMIAPPLEIPEADPVVDEVLQTKISGIMYDSSRPSAIVNFGETDQLVHKGDVVNGLKIVDITKNAVVIKYKANIYRATVGQSLDSGVNLNPVSNLSKQFGGAYSGKQSGVIQFN